MDRAIIENYIAQSALGNRQAFADLYDATSTKLFSICFRVLKDEGIAEEVLQECFIKIWHRANQYQQNGLSPMTWLITIARNSAIDRLRARHIHQSIDDIDEPVANNANSPEVIAESAAEQMRIEKCLDQLEDAKANAVKGAYLDGTNYADLAKRFEVPINTMRTWLRRSLIKLRECMSQ